ncbi:MAG: acetyl-CoA decarbonylase/synthase complex subunit delta, partial [Desulfarculaceae bacterium]|nr:acetyl-CoA decarbonylase/synthase complex subunit delta [Desulfarculaceae bacterium]
MAFTIPTIKYNGAIEKVTLGKGDKAITVGGETCYPFHTWEGQMPAKPVIAMEVWDSEPVEWPEAAKAPFEGVLGDPAAWAKKNVEEFGADAIVVQLKSTDPNGDDASPEAASEVVGKVLGAVDVPVIVWGSANPAKDAEVLKKIAEDHAGENLLLGPVDEDNHKQVGAAALAYKQSLISSSPIDVNLAKQLNILLGNLGVPLDTLIIDPTTGGLGYGLEYGYSVMERIRAAALVQEDDKLVLPMINNIGNEVWKSKEAQQSNEDAPELGDAMKRGYLMETAAAVAYLLAGSDIMMLRHPETVKLMKNVVTGPVAERARAAERVATDRPKAALIPGAKPKEKKAAAPKPAAAPAAPKAAAAPAAPA